VKQHHAVIHPKLIIKEALQSKKKITYLNDRFADWIIKHFLESLIMFDIALFVPLLLWNAPDSVKLMLALLSGSWIQWWALPALQRSASKTQAHQNAKAETDHRALTHIANMQDKQIELLEKIHVKMDGGGKDAN